ncbi:MAG: hypothetical protein ABIK07_24420 [Planctomycetota bacterium]
MNPPEPLFQATNAAKTINAAGTFDEILCFIRSLLGGVVWNSALSGFRGRWPGNFGRPGLQKI